MTTIETSRGVRDLTANDLNRAVHSFVANLTPLEPDTVRFPAVQIRRRSQGGWQATKVGAYIGLKVTRPLSTGRFGPPKQYDYAEAPTILLNLLSGEADLSDWRDSDLIALVVAAANAMATKPGDAHSLTLSLTMLLAAVHGASFNPLHAGVNLIPIKKET